MILYFRNLIKNNIKIFSVSFVSSLLLNILFLYPHYAVDSYSHMIVKYEEFSLIKSESGRPLSDSIITLTDMLGIELVKYQVMYTLLSIIGIAIAITMLVNLTIEMKKFDRENTKIVAALCVVWSLVFFNIFSSEMFVFSFMMPAVALAYLSITSSVCCIIKKNSLKNYFIAYILLSISLFMYQALAPLYMALIIIFTGYKFREEKFYRIIFKLIPPTLVYGLSCITNLIYIKLVTPAGERFNSTIDYVKNFHEIIDWQEDIWVNSYYLMHKYVWLLICISLLVLAVSIVKNKFKSTSILTLSILALFVLCMLPHIVLAYILIMPRTISPLGGLPAIIIIFAILFSDSKTKAVSVPFNIKKVMIIAVSVVFLCFTVRAVYNIALGSIISNYTDLREAKMIIGKIEGYERDTGKKVTKLAFKNDPSIRMAYDDIYVYGDMNIRAMAIDWSRLGLIVLASGRNFNIEDFKDSIYEEHFKDKNWDNFDMEQILIENDTAYIMVY